MPGAPVVPAWWGSRERALRGCCRRHGSPSWFHGLVPRKGCLRKGVSGTRNQAYFGARKGGPLEREGNSQRASERGLGKKSRSTKFSRCVVTVFAAGSNLTYRPQGQTWGDRIGKPVRSVGRCHRERGQERRLRAGEDQRFAGMPARHYFVLQRSESTSSLQEAPALTFVLRKRRGDHRWTQAGASSAVTSKRILVRERTRGSGIERCSGECEASAVG